MIEFVLTAFFLAKGPNPVAPDAGTSKAVSPKDMKYPVDIKSEDLEIQEKKQTAIWSRHVKVKRGTTDLRCDRLIAHYTKEQEVTRVECFGNVEVFDGDKWAKGERADFDNITGVLEVTGSPEAKQGKNHVKGTKVIFYKERDTIKVENATTVFESTSQTASDSSKPGSKAPQPKPEAKKGKP